MTDQPTPQAPERDRRYASEETEARARESRLQTSAARNEAVRRLKAAHPDEYRRYYIEECEERGVAPRVQQREPSVPDDPDVVALATECGDLRAENERLREELAAWQNRDPLSPDPERVQMLYAVRERDALKAENERLRATRDRVLVLHRPFGIYEECGHQHAEGEPGVTDALDVGLVCEDGRLTTVCFECCGDGYSQSEECANHHSDCWPCETRAALDTPEAHHD